MKHTLINSQQFNYATGIKPDACETNEHVFTAIVRWLDTGP